LFELCCCVWFKPGRFPALRNYERHFTLLYSWRTYTGINKWLACETWCRSRERLFFAYPFFWSWMFRFCRSPLVAIMLDENAMKRMRNLSLVPVPVGVVACIADHILLMTFFYEIASLLTVSFRLRCPLRARTIMFVIDFQLCSCGDGWFVQKRIFTAVSLRLSWASNLESKGASLSRCWIVLCRDTTGVYYTINARRQRVIEEMSLYPGVCAWSDSVACLRLSEERSRSGWCTEFTHVCLFNSFHCLPGGHGCLRNWRRQLLRRKLNRRSVNVVIMQLWYSFPDISPIARSSCLSKDHCCAPCIMNMTQHAVIWMSKTELGVLDVST